MFLKAAAMALVLTPISVWGQNIKIREKEPAEQTQELDLLSYDGKSPYFDIAFLKNHPKYYNGHQILFLPNDSPSYDYMDGFKVLESSTSNTVQDTLWNKGKTKIKKISSVTTEVYAPRSVKGKMVRTWSTSRGAETGDVKEMDGIFTAREAVEGRVFTVVDCSIQINTDWTGTTHTFDITLLDGEGTTLVWSCRQWIYRDEFHFMPIAMYDYIRRYQQYVGKTYVYPHANTKRTFTPNDFNFEDELECTELSFIADKTVYDSYTIGHFYTPVLFFKNEGKEYHYNIIPFKRYGWGQSNDSMSDFTFESLKEKDVYFTEKRIAAEARRQKEIADSTAKAEALAAAQEKKQQEEAVRKKQQQEAAARQKKAQEEEAAAAAQRYAQRVAYLTSQYGDENARLILQGKVKIGWTKEMCRESWGSPRDIKRTTTATTVHEQWIYYSKYLYFENGILTTIQD